MGNNKNKENPSYIIVMGIIALTVFPPLGILILVIGIMSYVAKADKSGNAAEKKTDYSGMSRDMLKAVRHEHSYNKEGTDFCGVSDKLTDHASHQHDYSVHEDDYCGMNEDMIANVTPKPKKLRKRGYDKNTTDQIYNELINRKTDYSGVDPNILRRG